MSNRIKAIFALIVVMFFSLLTALPAHAMMLDPSGGWLMNDKLRIRTFTDYSKLYRISAEKIVGYNFYGDPKTETITWVDQPFNADRISLGHQHCKVSSKINKKLVAVTDLDTKKITKAWTFDGKKFTDLDISLVSCDFSAFEN